MKVRVCQLFEVYQHEFANLCLPCEGRFRLNILNISKLVYIASIEIKRKQRYKHLLELLFKGWAWHQKARQFSPRWTGNSNM